MSVIGSNILAGASGQGGGYNLTNSLRFRSSASAYLNRTYGTPTDAKKWTLSLWLKRGLIGSSSYQIMSAGSAVSDQFHISSDSLSLYLGGAYRLVTTQVLRDPAAWYHIVLVIDTANATADNRNILYINGVQVTSFSTRSNLGLNATTNLNAASTVTHIGRYAASSSEYIDGYLAEVNFIDGQALAPSSFGETSATTGVWIPKKFSGTYGTNGFYLKFTDTTSTSTLGTDFSGNSNTWTVNNISLTAGSTYDSMTDVPTLTSATAANYCTLNAALQAGGYTLNDGNLNWARTGGTGGANDRSQFGTIGVTSGKWYWEFTAGTVNSNSIPAFGIAIGSASTQSWAGNQTGVVIYNSDGTKTISGTSSSYGSSFTTGDIIGVAFDADAGTLTFYKNNTSQGQAASGLTSGSYFPAVTRSVGGGGSNGTEIANFGQRPFAYTPPTGFVRLNTFNLPTPTIGATAATTANKYMDVVLYSGNNSTQNIAVGFQPDWVWSKCRNVARSHRLSDAVRGSTRDLYSDTTASEQNDGSITAFISTGFSLDNATGSTYNTSGENYVSWAWKANGAGSTNTAGSITSTVSASTTAGFSVVTGTFPASGTSCTFGHGLGVAPSMIISKGRDGGTSNWIVRHTSLGNMTTKYLEMNNTGGVNTGSNAATAPSSTLASVSTDGLNNNMAFVAYCFAQIAGYSAFGSYTGNGSSDGTFVFTGFRPRFVLYKSATSASVGDWRIHDTSRSTFNAAQLEIYAQSAAAEPASSNAQADILSNGFKLRGVSGNTSWNESGVTYIYACFAESPFKYANAR